MKKIFNLVAALLLLATTAHAQQNIWIGNTPSWVLPTNWSLGTAPGAGTDVLIPSGKGAYPVINSTSAGGSFCRMLTIQSGAGNPSVTIPFGKMLTISATGTAITNAGLLKIDGTLVVKGSIVNNGTVTSTAGLLNLTNASPITIGGTGRASLYNITFAGTGQTTFASTLSNQVQIANRALLSNTGSAEANGKVRFVSAAVGGATPSTPCGYVYYPSGSSARFNGVITVQRAISSKYNLGDGYRHYSTPVNMPKFDSLATRGTGAFTPNLNTSYNYPADAAVYPPNVQAYREDLVPAAPATGYDAFSYGWRSPATSYLETGKGYTLRINTAAKVALTGNANAGSYATAPLTRSTTGAASGWNFVGNPYPSPIDIYKVILDNFHDDVTNPNGFEGTAYFFHSNTALTGNYSSISVDSISSDSVTQLFPVMQGFFVRKAQTPVGVTQTPQSYLFNDSQRADPLNYPSVGLTPFYRQAAAAAVPASRWLFRMAVTDTETKAVDNANVGFRAGATAGYDSRYDAERPGDNVGMPTVCTFTATAEACMMNIMPALTVARTVPVGLSTLVAGRTYTMAAPAKQAVPAGVRVWLEDRATGKAVELSAGRGFSFKAEATRYDHRFFLRFEPATTLTAAATERVEVAVYPNPAPEGNVLQVSANKMSGATATATLVNAFGQVVKTLQVPVREGLLSGEVPTKGLPLGVYLLRITTETGVTTRRIEIR